MSVEIETIIDIASEIFNPSYKKMMEFKKALELKMDDCKSVYSEISEDTESVKISVCDTVIDVLKESQLNFKDTLHQIESDIKDYKFKLSKLTISEEVVLPINFETPETFTIQFDISFEFTSTYKYVFLWNDHQRRYCYINYPKLNILGFEYNKDIECNKKYNISLSYNKLNIDQYRMNIFINNELQGTIGGPMGRFKFIFGCIQDDGTDQSIGYVQHSIKNATVTDFYYIA